MQTPETKFPMKKSLPSSIFGVVICFAITLGATFTFASTPVSDYIGLAEISPADEHPVFESDLMSEDILPLVELSGFNCGIFNYTTSSIIKATQPAVGTSWTAYEWKFTELEAPFTTYEVISPNGTNPNFRLQWFPDIEYGRSYEVSMRLYDGVEQGVYGNTCEIGLQANVETTRLAQQFSNGFFSFCSVVGARAVGGASQYRWIFDDLNEAVEVFGVANSRLLRLQTVPGLQLGATYVVSVFATVNGVEGPQGTLRFLNTNGFVPNTGLNQSLFACGLNYPVNSQVEAVEVCSAETYTWRFRNTSQVQPDLIYTRTDGSRFIRLDWVDGFIFGDSYDVEVKARQGGVNGDYSSICNIIVDAPIMGLAPNNDPELVTWYGAEEVSIDENQEFEIVSDRTFVNGNNLTISVANPSDKGQVLFSLYDLNGRLIAMKNQPVSNGGAVNWDVNDLPQGIYILKAFDGEVISTKKITLF